jgi:regulation of enolase protein 1 (concanavalin A-like superfamily)
MHHKTVCKSFSLLFLFSLLAFGATFAVAAPARDGKLLRSEAWQPFSAASAKADFFVSARGNDQWSGTLAESNAARTDGPFATLERAQRAVREMKSKVYLPKGKPIDVRYVGTSYPFGKGKDIVVFIREGYYTLSQPLVFTPEDGGERIETNLPSGAFEWHHLRDNYVTYAAYPGEKPVISGAVKVGPWKKNDAAWTTTLQMDDVPTLIANGKKQMLARIPNTGYFTLRHTPASTSEIPFKPGDIQTWENMQDNRIAILLRWRTAYNSIARIDQKKQIAYLRDPENGPGGHNGLLVVPPRYYIENIEALLDAAGEWFYDKSKHELKYIPANDILDPNAANLCVPQLNQLVQIKGTEDKPVRNLRFYGLAFEGAKENFRNFPHYYDATPGCVAITFEYAYQCEFAQSELRACFGVGMYISPGCYQMRVFDNIFDGLEQGALHIVGTGDMKNGKLGQLTRETQITRNVFSNCGHGGGITLAVFSTLHTIISHNYFTKTGRPYTMDCGGGGLEGNLNDNITIEYNHFDEVQTDADDAGVMVTNGMTFDSHIRNNLIHRVQRGFFSDNVAFWFDNMSSGWDVQNNIYYDIEQGTMKTCGTYLSDNTYKNNFVIDPPKIAPEKIIEGMPEPVCSELRLSYKGQPITKPVPTGSIIQVEADVTNTASSGVADVILYVNRKPMQAKPFPTIRHNTRKINFDLRLEDSGLMDISVGETRPESIVVQGEKPTIVYDNIACSEERVLAGQSVRISALATNVQTTPAEAAITMYLDDKKLDSYQLAFNGRESKLVAFEITPAAGTHALQIGNSDIIQLVVLKSKTLDVKKQKLLQYISPKAKPAQVMVDQSQGRYTVKASGWDFYHAEDAYATVYLKQLPGDFIATVKIAAFGERTNEWYRAGLFVRNDISKSFDVERGSKGSVLMFSTPGRAGIECDEFGDGCMHKAASENLPENSPTPIWIKLERHGDRFTGYISLDGKTWIIKRQTNVIPGIGRAVDLGLAAGSPDQKQYTVEFSDWTILQEDK